MAETNTTDDHLRLGTEYLQRDAPAEGETLQQWAERVVGTGADRADWVTNPAPLRDEATRLCELWEKRVREQGWGIAQGQTIKENHLRSIIAGFKAALSQVINSDMPAGFLQGRTGGVPAFKRLWAKAKRDLQGRKLESGRTLTFRMECGMTMEDADRIAMYCLEMADGQHGKPSAARAAQHREKWLHAYMQLVMTLQGPRAGMLLASQRMSDTKFKPFGAGSSFATPLFRNERQPPSMNLERRAKGETNKELLSLIMCRLHNLCPWFATFLLRLSQYGRFAGAALPPEKVKQYSEGDYPMFAHHLADRTKHLKDINTTALTEACKALGLSTDGGAIKQLRQVMVALGSSNPEVPEDIADAAADHSGKKLTKAETEYLKTPAGRALVRAMYGCMDPQASAALKTVLAVWEEPELLELALMLVHPDFALKYQERDLDDTMLQRWYDDVLVPLKAGIVLSRARLYGRDMLLHDDAYSIYDLIDFLRQYLSPLDSQPFWGKIGDILGENERIEIALEEDALLPATQLQERSPHTPMRAQSLHTLPTTHVRSSTESPLIR